MITLIDVVLYGQCKVCKEWIHIKFQITEGRFGEDVWCGCCHNKGKKNSVFCSMFEHELPKSISK